MPTRNFLLISYIFLIISCNGQDKNEMKHKYTNHLINETSPYLLQHAHNPVDWHAWNEATLALAKKEKKLILISIGYAACHWCHVMEEESFEDEQVATYMNQHFINIKIDREERPDVDQIYMNAVQLMTGKGGWPLNCIALPDGRPFWGGTYFPKENWLEALKQIVKLHQEEPNKIEEYAQKLTEGIKENNLITLNTDTKDFTLKELDSTVSKWQDFLDNENGGNKGAPKFPMPNNYQFLLRYAVQKDDSNLLQFVNTTLTKMALGGLNDQVEGGFARYSVDEKWHIPHYEKMLYDNGQLMSLYAKAYAQTKNKLYKKVVYETDAFISRELTDKSGGFYSSLDADSKTDDGQLEEGVYYVFTKPELQQAIADDFDLFSDYYNISDAYKWENDTYHLYRTLTNQNFAKKHNLSITDLEQKAKQWKDALTKLREKRAKPRLDDKILTSWNALMATGYIDAYKAFNDNSFLKKAKKNLNFILTRQRNENGGLHRNFKAGKSTINAYLIDYATVTKAFLDMYEVTLDKIWLTEAKQLTDYCFDNFYDDHSKMFFFTSKKDTELINRQINTEDNVIPSSNAIMANNLFLLSHYFDNKKYRETALQMLHNVKNKISEYPGAYSEWLWLYSNTLNDFYEIAVVGKDAMKKVAEINNKFIPNKLIVGSTTESSLPLLAYKYSDGETTIFVCIDGTCKLPVDSSEKALEQIQVKFRQN